MDDKPKEYTIYDIAQTEAIAEVLEYSDMNFFRHVCRWFSKNFNTPLSEVMECKKITWDQMLLHYYEDKYEKIGYNDVYDIACAEYLPEIAKENEEEDEIFAAAMIAEQERTLAIKKKEVEKNTEPVKIGPEPVKMKFEDEPV